MKINLTWFNRILISILTIGCLIITGCSIYVIILNNTNSEPQVPILYKEGLVEELDQTKDADVLNLYKTHTRPIFIKENSINNSGELGTMWSYPVSVNNNRYYFATAIHVVASALVYDINTPNTFHLNPNYGLYSVSNYSANSKITRFDIKLNDIRIEKTFLTNQYEQTLRTETPYNVTDYIIMSTSTRLQNINNDDYLIDTPEEFNKMLTADEYYVCGFPYSENDYRFRTAKYINQHKNNVYTTTMAKYFGLEKYRTDDNKSFSVNDTQGKETNFWSYANMLIFEDMYVGGGASGSLITTKIDGKIKFVGLLLGDISINNFKKYKVYSDLFYTPPYNLTSTLLANGYNHTLNANAIQYIY